MPSWLPSLFEIFKGSDGRWDWTRIGVVLGAAGVVIGVLAKAGCEAFKFRAERKKKLTKTRAATALFNQVKVPPRLGDTTFQGPTRFGLSPEPVERFLQPGPASLPPKMLRSPPRPHGSPN